MTYSNELALCIDDIKLVVDISVTPSSIGEPGDPVVIGFTSFEFPMRPESKM